MSKAHKVLLIRLDKIGDLVSTLPVDQHPTLLNAKTDVRWLVGLGMSKLVDCADPPRNFNEWPKKFSSKSFLALLNFLKFWKPQLVISFHSPWWVHLALLLARVPDRVGPASQWHHFFFLNRRLRQQRSESIKHEADYNWQLLRFGLKDDLQLEMETPVLKIHPATGDRLPDLLVNKKYYVIHAGMAGSALNWPQSNYIELAQQLTDLGFIVVLTGTHLDAPYLTEIRPALKANARVVDLVEQLSFSNLLLVLKSAEGLLAPSTGVAHLSASLGVLTTSLYSPLPVQSATRWAPRGPKSKTFSPTLKCPSHFRCLKQECSFHPCMSRITVEQVYSYIRAEIGRA